MKPEVRQVERILALTNVKIIRDAIFKTFFDKGAKYEGRPPDVKHLKDADRFLTCHLKHIVSAIGEAADVLVDPLEAGIRKALAIHYGSQLPRVRRKFSHTEDPESKHKAFKDDPTYCWFSLKKGGWRGLAKSIRQIMETHETSELIPAPDAILHRLKAYCKRSGMYSLWRLRETDRTLPNGNYEETLERIPDTIRVRTVAFEEMDESHPRMLIHIEFVHCSSDKNLREHTEIIKEGLLSLMSKRHQRKGRYVYCPDRDDSKVLEILEVPKARADAPLICLPQQSRMSETEKFILSDFSAEIATAQGSENYVVGCVAFFFLSFFFLSFFPLV